MFEIGPCELCHAIPVREGKGWVTDHDPSCGWLVVLAAEYALDGVTPMEFLDIEEA